MTTNELHKRHAARPFDPFVIVMADGTRYAVYHPEQLAYAQGARTCVVYTDDGELNILDLLLMTALEPAPRRSGRRRAA